MKKKDSKLTILIPEEEGNTDAKVIRINDEMEYTIKRGEPTEVDDIVIPHLEAAGVPFSIVDSKKEA